MNFKFPKQHIFEKYLMEYLNLPQYKRVLNSMIKFKDMYQDVYTLPYLGKAMADKEKELKFICLKKI